MARLLYFFISFHERNVCSSFVFVRFRLCRFITNCRYFFFILSFFIAIIKTKSLPLKMSRIFHKYGALVVQITLPTVPWSNAKSKSPFHFCKTLICPACTMGLYHSLFQIFRFHPGAMYIAIYTSQLYSQRDLFLFLQLFSC